MCGRYTLTQGDLSPIGRVLGVDLGTVRPRYNIAPGQEVAVVRHDRPFELGFARWGLVPHWSPSARPQYKAINARAETVAVKPAFRDAFRRRRCLIPADGFYEWQRLDGAKQPWFIHFPDRRLFAFAGLWERWQGGGEVLETCAIIVAHAVGVAAAIHERMPVVLPPEAYGPWLDPVTPRATLEALLAPRADGLVATRVSTRVNDPRNDDPELIRPLG